MHPKPNSIATVTIWSRIANRRMYPISVERYPTTNYNCRHARETRETNGLIKAGIHWRPVDCWARLDRTRRHSLIRPRIAIRSISPKLSILEILGPPDLPQGSWHRGVWTLNPEMFFKALARNLSANATPRKPPRRLFVIPAPPEQISMERINQVPTLRDELVPTGISTLPLMEDLKHEHDSLGQEIGRQQDALDALTRMQRKYVPFISSRYLLASFSACFRCALF